MKKTRMEKGITLIALIITIVVLLILAAVAISSITNDGILGYATNATSQYNKAQKDEQYYLDYYGAYLSGKLWKQEGTVITRETENGIITLNVGDKIEYNELSNGTKTYSVDYTVNGGESASDSQSFSTEDLQWRVLGVSDKGELEIVSATPTTSTVYLRGEKGYLNAEDILNNTANALYGKGQYATGARALKQEDINRLANYDVNTAYNANRVYQYKFSSETGYMQSRRSKDNGKTWEEWIDTTTSEHQTCREPGKTKTLSSTNTEDIIELKNTYYTYKISTLIPDTLKTSDGILISKFFTQGVNESNNGASGTDIKQWLASTAVNSGPNAASFRIYRIWDVEGETTATLYESHEKQHGPYTRPYRPVVSLQYNITLTNENGTWKISDTK